MASTMCSGGRAVSDLERDGKRGRSAKVGWMIRPLAEVGRGRPPMETIRNTQTQTHQLETERCP
jgi:hypothetical protein